MRRLLWLLLVLALVGGAGAYVWRSELGLTKPSSQGAGAPGGRRGARGGRGEGPVSVLTEPVQVADVPVILEAVGTAQALNSVTVRSQVDGRLLAIAFREGQDVRKGDVLARIDPTIYQAQYDQAVAKKQQDEANLANARLDLDRYASLARTNYGSKQQADTQRASVAQLEAQVKADGGAVDSARAYLDYTTIVSPIDGRTGIRLVDAGNLVRASDTTGLVVVTQLKPVSVLFNLPQQNLRAVTAAAERGAVPVQALESDNRTVLDTGRLEVVDNQVDATTGTVRIKATFPNAELQLWPGAFVNVRLIVDVTRGAVTVPVAAVQRGPNGPFVYEVRDDKAVLKAVTVARQTETVAVIASGVEPSERVITTGFARLTDGDPVRVADPEPAAATAIAPASAPPRRARPAGEGGGSERRRRPDAASTPEAASRDGDPPGATAVDNAERRRRPLRSDEGRQGASPALPGGAGPGSGAAGSGAAGSGAAGR